MESEESNIATKVKWRKQTGRLGCYQRIGRKYEEVGGGY